MQDKLISPDTYHARTQVDAEIEAQGRFAGRQKARVVGTTPTPEEKTAPRWSRDFALTPTEPPLGARVDDLPDMLSVPTGPRLGDGGDT